MADNDLMARVAQLEQRLEKLENWRHRVAESVAEFLATSRASLKDKEAQDISELDRLYRLRNTKTRKVKPDGSNLRPSGEHEGAASKLEPPIVEKIDVEEIIPEEI